MDHNMAAVDQINLLSRQNAARLNDLEARFVALETSVNLRLLKVEQTLRIARAPNAPIGPAPVAPVIVPRTAALRPGHSKVTSAATPASSAPAPSPDLAMQLLDLVRALSPSTADSIVSAFANAADPAPAPAPAQPSEPEAWLAAEQPGAPPIVEVATSHVDH
jgi:hypothetical protein